MGGGADERRRFSNHPALLILKLAMSLAQPTHPLFNFRNTELVEVAISSYASATSINFPIESSLQLGPIRATSLIEAVH